MIVELLVSNELVWYITNSGQMLSQSCDLAVFSLLMAMASSLAVKSPNRLASALSARKRKKKNSRDSICVQNSYKHTGSANSLGPAKQ